ncbi:hypothetical protein [Nocardioides speluncae]|uniref:hypothetical protein n=1 Tax=Nocardioides speluncae TaxID=2670337 RepID=UPI000D6967BF|nr:hypothetical protein [Nocardioides speluncae]
MDKSTVIRTAIAAGVAAAGLSVGGVALAAADDDGSPESKPEAGVRHAFHDDFAERLAEELGVPEEDVEEALDEVRDELVPNVDDLKERFEKRFGDGERPDRDDFPEPPSEEEMEQHKQEFEKALAEALGISEDELSDAFKELREAAESGIRGDLEERLDSAVEDGDLTEADKESVLKAYDAGVIGFPGFGKVFGGPGLHFDHR